MSVSIRKSVLLSCLILAGFQSASSSAGENSAVTYIRTDNGTFVPASSPAQNTPEITFTPVGDGTFVPTAPGYVYDPKLQVLVATDPLYIPRRSRKPTRAELELMAKTSPRRPGEDEIAAQIRQRMEFKGYLSIPAPAGAAYQVPQSSGYDGAGERMAKRAGISSTLASISESIGGALKEEGKLDTFKEHAVNYQMTGEKSAVVGDALNHFREYLKADNVDPFLMTDEEIMDEILNSEGSY